jgi:hypothetical protein
MRNISVKVVEKIKTRILRSIAIFRKSCLLKNSVENCDKPGQATVSNVV